MVVLLCNDDLLVSRLLVVIHAVFTISTKIKTNTSELRFHFHSKIGKKTHWRKTSLFKWKTERVV